MVVISKMQVITLSFINNTHNRTWFFNFNLTISSVTAGLNSACNESKACSVSYIQDTPPFTADHPNALLPSFFPLGFFSMSIIFQPFGSRTSFSTISLYEFKLFKYLPFFSPLCSLIIFHFSHNFFCQNITNNMEYQE